MDAALWPVGGVTLQMLPSRAALLRGRGPLRRGPTWCGVSGRVPDSAGEGTYQSGFSVPKPTASSVTYKVGARVTLGPARGVLGNGTVPCLLRPLMRRTRL